MGDIRFPVDDWLVNPKKYSRGYIQMGLGLKFPTGNFKYEYYFHTSDSTKVLGPVDQSIHLGDGCRLLLDSGMNAFRYMTSLGEAMVGDDLGIFCLWNLK
ncbi:MAG: hypothetical protein ACYCOO_09120 [Chitinophagaceae bacterium]